MRILVDTNIILRLAQPKNTQHSEVISTLTALNSEGHELCLVPQIFFEYWVVATRPVAQNGLGMLPAEVHQSIDMLQHSFSLLPDGAGLFHRWLELVSEHDVKGRTAHDARIVAAMQTHSVEQILTYNRADFVRYTDITVLSPEEHQP